MQARYEYKRMQQKKRGEAGRKTQCEGMQRVQTVSSTPYKACLATKATSLAENT